MSAFMCSDNHINAIITYASCHGVRARINREWVPIWGNEQKFASLLATANAESLHVRYDDETIVTAITYRAYHVQSEIEVLKLLDCFDYQACEVDAYEDTPAAHVVNCIRKDVVCRLPGYADAPWGLD